MNKLYWLIILFLTCSVCAAQNLVPNPSYEVYDTCPDNASQISYAVPWRYPTTGTADYYNSCSPDSLFSVSVPNNWGGHQYARTGNGYAGFFARAGGYVEYAQVELTDSLIAGKNYCISFYISMADTCAYSISSAGMYISNIAPSSSNYYYLPYAPQIQNPATTFFNDTSWTEVSGIYTALGGEKYITIGNFGANPFPDTLLIHNDFVHYNPQVTYLYLDDVSLSNCDSTSGFNGINEHFSIAFYPNPITDKLNITLKNNEFSEIIFFDILSRKLLQQKFINSVSLNTGEWAKGIYLYEVRNKNGVIKKGKVVKD